MAKINANKLEKDIAKKEEELLQEFKEELLAMNEEEFKQYFNHLIDKYYKIAFTFEANHSKYYEETKKQYKTIKKVKRMLASTYNNLDNYENGIRLEKAEDIAYNYMIELNSMEKSYNNIVYHNCTQELIYINSSLTNLIDLYEKEPSEALVDVIEGALTNAVELLRTINKLPVHENIEEIKEEVTFKKEHLSKGKFSKEDLEGLPEEWNVDYYTTSVLSIQLKHELEKYEEIYKKLEAILPEDVLINFEADLYSSEAVNFLNVLLKSMDYEEAVEIVAFNKIMQEKNSKGYLYNIIEKWS